MEEKWRSAYIDYQKGMKYKDIADKYQVSINTVKSWKTRNWNNPKCVHTKKKRTTKERRAKKNGAPFGNKNGIGPPGNQNAKKHGLFSKWLPKDTKEIVEMIPNDPLELLWINIQLQFSAIIRSQQIMYVKDHEDKTIEKNEYKNGDIAIGEKWEVQQAWDKQATFLNAQSRAMKTLESMMKSYDELLHKDWDNVSEEKKKRIELIQAQIDNLQKVDNSYDDDGVIIINDIAKYDEEE